LIIEISYSDGNWLISLIGFSTFQNHLLSIMVLNVMQASTWKTPNGKVWLVKMLIIGQGYSDAFCLHLRAFATENGLKKGDQQLFTHCPDHVSLCFYLMSLD
jgi:hypothetical protein